MSVKKIDPEKIIKGLKVRVDATGKAGLRGLVRWALAIKRDAMKNAPVVTGNLRASAFVVSGYSGAGGGTSNESGGGFKGKVAAKLAGESAMKKAGAQALCGASPNPMAYTGFTAFYAPYVEHSEGAGKGKHKRGVAAYKQRSSVGGKLFLKRAVAAHKADGPRLVAAEIGKVK